MTLIGPQNVVPIDHNRELQQRGQKPEIKIARHGPAQHALAADHADLFAEIAERIAVEFARRICRRHARNAKARRQTKQRAAHQSYAGAFLVPTKIKSKKSARHGSRDRGQKRSQFDHAIAPGEVFLRQQFRQQAVFRGPKDGCL